MIVRLIAFLCLVAAPAAAAAETFRFDAFGLTVDGPPGWIESSPEEWRRNLELVETGDEDIDDLLKTHAEAPLLQLLRHPEPWPELNPSFSIKLRAGRVEDPVALLTALKPSFRGLFEQVAFVDGPRSVEVDGEPAAVVTMTYLLSFDGAEALFPTRSSLWIVPRGERFLIIGVGGPEPLAADVAGEQAAAVASIRFD